MTWIDRPSIGVRVWPFVLLVSLLVVPQSSLCQSKENLPVPEYYGIYAVVAGKLIKLDSQHVQADETVRARLGQRNGVGNILGGEPVAASKAIDIAKFASDLKIVVFSQPSGMQSPLDIAKSLHLESLVFIRNLTVNTGWPNNVRRSGAENGWDSGDAPELMGIASGGRSKLLEFLVKPMPGHQDMVVAGLPEQLKSGVYRLSVGERNPFFGGGGFLFAVEPIPDAEASKCVDALVTYSMNMSDSKYTPCGERRPSETTNQTEGASAVAGASVSSQSPCGDYDSCMRAGKSAFRPSSWSEAIADFQTAANQRPASGEPWIWLGRAHIAAGREPDALQAWDKAIALGSTIEIGVCHTRTLLPCERGDLNISPSTISFNAMGRDVFTVPPSEVMAKGMMNLSQMGHVSFALEAQRKRYLFDFIPFGVNCQIQLVAQCPQQGMAQQMVVANYVSRSLPKLSSGELGPAKADAPAAANDANRAPLSEASSQMDSTSAIGLWSNAANPSEHFELRSGGQFLIDEHGQHHEGTWDLHGNTLALHFSKRSVGKAQWDGQAFIDNENKQWVRTTLASGATAGSTSTSGLSRKQVNAADVATWRSRIDAARSDATRMPPYNGDWQSFITLKLSGSLDGYNQLYLAAVNRRSLALDQLVISDSWLSKGEIDRTKGTWEKAVRLTIDSNSLTHAANDYYIQGVSNTAAVLNEAYQISSNTAADLGYAVCGQPCYDGIDLTVFVSDYAVESAIQGKAVADQDAIKGAVIKLLLDSTGVGSAATARVTHFVGEPDSAYVLVDQMLQQPQFKQQIMTAIGRSSVYLTGAALSAAADQIWQGLVAINRDCGNISSPVPSGKTQNGPNAVVLAMLLPDFTGKSYLLVPFMNVSNNKYVPLPDGTPSNSLESAGKGDFLPSGDPNLKSPSLMAAIQQSPLKASAKFKVYRAGKEVGSFDVTDVTVAYPSIPQLKVVGYGQTSGFQPKMGDLAVAGASSHQGIWSTSQLTPIQKQSLRDLALAQWPQTVPANKAMPGLVGKPLHPTNIREQIFLFNLNRDGGLQAFIANDADMSTGSASKFPASSSVLASYDSVKGTWRKLFGCSYVGATEAISGDNTCSLMDVLDVNNDGTADLVMEESHGEVSDIVIYEWKEDHLNVVARLSGWSGS